MRDITPPDSQTEHLLRYKTQIEAALKHADNSHSFDQIVCGVLQGKLHFYPMPNSFVIMEVHQYPNWSAYHVFLAGGTFSEIIGLQPTMIENAKTLNCKRLTLTGRKGFAKRLQHHGWSQTHVHMSLTI